MKITNGLFSFIPKNAIILKNIKINIAKAGEIVDGLTNWEISVIFYIPPNAMIINTIIRSIETIKIIIIIFSIM